VIICSAKIQRMQAAIVALWPEVLMMPMQLLVCCHTNKQHACGQVWQSFLTPSIVITGPSSLDQSLISCLLGSLAIPTAFGFLVEMPLVTQMLAICFPLQTRPLLHPA